jgi:DNA-binding SARP family transcriptional activator/Tfp pilus assembly protein PilF
MLKLSLFNRFSLTFGADEVAVSAARHQALIAYVGLQTSLVCGREQLATLLWGDTGDANARHSLSQAVLALRKKLEPYHPGFLTADRASVRFIESEIWIDVRHFDRLIAIGDSKSIAQAIALFKSGFLEGFHSGASAFDDWADNERSRLWMLYRSAVEQYAENLTMPPERVIEAITRLSLHDQFDESVHRLMLRALVQRFGSPAALAYAEKVKKLLDRELGVDPEPATTALVADIRATPRMSTPQPLNPPLGKPPNLGPQAASVPRLFENVPPRDFNFTGRTGHLAGLHDCLVRFDTTATNRVAVHGLSGIGKTTLVAEYAYRRSADYAGVWWARAGQRTLLVESLAALAAQLDPSLAMESNQYKAAIAGLAILGRLDKPFLLIYDDVGSPDVIIDFIPPSNASVIITSRWPDWAGRALEVKLDAFDEAAAVEFLQKRTGRLDAAGARRLATALGFLPLALDHAGAYCRLSALNFDGYLKRIDSAIAHAPRGVTYPASIAATFGLALETANANHESAEALLGYLAFLAPERIPLDLVGNDVMDHFQKEGALAALYAVSLLDHEATEEGAVLITLHPLVQSAMRFRLAGKKQSSETARRTAELLAKAFPATALTDPKTWTMCASLLRHALALREISPDVFTPDENSSQLLSSLGCYLHIRGAYGEAEQIFRESISVAESVLGAEHPIVATRQNNLALLLSTIGRYSEAEPLLRQIITQGEKSLGRHHIEIAVRLNNLGRLLSDTKRYGEAEPLYREAIAIADTQVGSDMTYAVSWRNNLGILLNETGRNDKGEQIYREALAIGLKTLGGHHHEVARCLNNLGFLLRDINRLDESEALVRDALAIWAEMLGEEHPIYARGQENLAKTLLVMGRPGEALAAAQAALQVHESKLGVVHFWTRDSAMSCAKALAALGQVEHSTSICDRFHVSLS